MRVIATTVIRYSRLGEEPTGHILDIDFDEGRVLKKIPSPDPINIHSNPNPRGGTRGGRGIRYHLGKILISNHDTIFIYDRKLKKTGEVTHPLLAGIHEIETVRDGIWVSSTDIDSVVKVDYDGREVYRWCLHDDERLGDVLGIHDPPAPDWKFDHRMEKNSAYDRGHLNSALGHKGRLVVTLGLVLPRPPRNGSEGGKGKVGSRKPGPLKKWLKGTRMFHRRKLAQVDSEGVILELDPKRGKAKVLFRNPAVVPDHNGVPWGHDKLLLNKTGLRELFVIDRASGKVERRIALPGNWLRGLHPLDDRRVMVGTGPTAIHLVDVPSGKVLKSMSISQDPNESVHGLYVFPE